MDNRPTDKSNRPPSAIDDLAEGFETLHNLRARLTIAMMWIVPTVAIIYGAVAWKPYYLGLGLAALFLLFVSKRMERNRSQPPERPLPPTE
jgi:hypothetical protein